ncbi:hypothetical protein E2C01_043811 [Portunus trituberculatus]|uniref:Uncharacterized protein n=1 Tax=Portunus trituberculatus TaxID=210409 RepID=A0A5B7FYB2_PORTR|nr:hypothetical protein [Portunus trituberculatus]
MKVRVDAEGAANKGPVILASQSLPHQLTTTRLDWTAAAPVTDINAPSHLDHTARYLRVSRQRCVRVGADPKVMSLEERSHLARVAVLYSLTPPRHHQQAGDASPRASQRSPRQQNALDTLNPGGSGYPRCCPTRKPPTARGQGGLGSLLLCPEGRRREKIEVGQVGHRGPWDLL